MAAMNDRGQMLLIGAIIMAASFIALGIVLNGSIHTETIASQASQDVTAGQPTLIQQSVETDIESLVERVVENNPGSPGIQESRLTNYVSQYTAHAQSYFARTDAIVSVSATGPPAMGTRVEHASGEFVSSSGSREIVDDGRVREFTLDSLSFTGSGPFIIRIEDVDGDVWNVRFENTGGDPQIRVRGGPNSIDETCTASDGPIDIGEGIIASSGERCTALSHIDAAVPPYDIHFIGGDQIEGEYELLISRGANPPSPATTSNDVYGIETQMRVESLSQANERTVMIAPGEIHD